MYDDTPPPLNVAATVMPLTAMRPSLTWPPRALKNVIVGVTATPLPSTVRPGVALSSEPTVRVRGNRGNRVGGEHGFAAHALHVHDGRLAGDGDGFLEAADAHAPTGIVSMAEPPSTMPSRLTVLKPGQRERQGVGAGSEVDEPVLARSHR